MSRRRSRIPMHHSRKLFRRGAQRIHPKNGLPGVPMRGGIRL